MSISKPNREGVAAVLSLLIPGVGQFYNGTFLRGIFWLIITPGLWIGSGGFLGWLCHIIAAITAYNYAKRSHDSGEIPRKIWATRIEENFDVLKDDRK